MNLVRSELRKLLTTNVWWIFGVVLLGTTTLTLLVAIVEANFVLGPEAAGGPEPADQYAATAVNLYTSGQFFGLMFALLLGTLLMTNEYAHQTASASFLTTPRRDRVVVAKLVTAVGVGVVFWAATTVVDLIGGVLFFTGIDAGPQLGEPTVLAAIGLNLLAYVLWAILGIGLGTLIRSQLATVIVAIAMYVLTGTIGLGILFALSQWTGQTWLVDLAVLLPSTASDLMVTGVTLVDLPPRWVGGLVLVAYGVLAGAAGTMITQRRDIS
ncbi:MAG: ABC transporter permease [Micromonosporaceae bacterium]